MAKGRSCFEFRWVVRVASACVVHLSKSTFKDRDMYGLPIEKRAETAKVTLRKACNGTANTKKFSEALAGLPQTPKSFPRDLRDSRKHQKFLERLAGLPQTPKHFPRDLRNSRKRQSISRETCGTPANTKKFLERLAELPQTPRQKESVRRVLFPVHALCSASTLWMEPVTWRSSQAISTCRA